MTNIKKKTPNKQEISGRNQDGTFAKGVSGNPEGRPKGISITEMVMEALEEIEPQTKETWKSLIVKKILIKAISEGDTNLIKTIWSYIDGTPVSRVEMSGGDKPLEIETKLSPEQEKLIALGIAEVIKKTLK